MKRIPLILLAIVGLTMTSTTLSGCGDTGTGDGDGDTSGDGDGDGDGLVEVADPITVDTTWTADREYVLTDLIFVQGATLTIEPGTVVRGLSGSALIIDKDAMLTADGTADAPIVFTSNQSSPAPGDWGGVVLIGEAEVNLEGCVGQAEGFPNPPEYGGCANPAHNCGTLRYVRVEYAGFAISDGNELNGITFYACGTDTTVSYVQSHMGLDDGIEMFGGGFDIDHIVVTGANDDSLDMDQGYRGTATNVFIQQNPGVGDNCFEVSNQGTNFSATPKTSPEICNATCIGSGSAGEKSKGLTVKEGTNASWHASIFANITNEATLLADEATYSEVDGGNIEIANNIFFANGDPEHVSEAETLDTAGWDGWIWDAARANHSVDPGLGIDWGSPNAVPTGDVAGDGSGCGGTSYVGAVDPAGDDWTAATWINWTP